MNLYKSSLLLSTLLFFIFNSAFPQGGTWTWISGDSAFNSPGIYGTQGVPSINNHPPGEYEAVEFKDHQGNFWIYGGTDPGMSDLWKFNPLTLEWTWVKGNGQQNDTTVFGTKGISNPANTPGQRTLCAVTWVDTSGIFWLFGGEGASNDLWKYDINTNEWTWTQGGSGAAVYGTQGIPSPSNTPGSSKENCSAWTDSLNNLWLFASGDLWRFDISILEWTWMKGAVFGGLTNYGVKGVADSSNDPGTRYSYTKWKDLKGNFWLMGGVINGDLNDVWKYDLNINEWTWMSGPNVYDDPGTYQSNCVFNTVNRPSSRLEQRSSVTDNYGRFWLFGGYNYVADISFNDLWIFDPQQLEWNWLSDTNVTVNGNYGSLGVPALSNSPPSRFGADAWWGNDNKFYMFGGLHNNYGANDCYADVWVFNPDTNCVSGVAAIPPVANFQSGKTTLCAFDCINFTDLSANNPVSWQWRFAGAIDSTSTSQNPQGICYLSAGIYNVTLIATNSAGSDTVTFNNYITVSPAPPTPVITQIGTTLYCSTDPSYTSYQWYLDSVLISGATDTSLIITQGGNYNVQVSNSSNCKIAVGINIILGVQNYMNDNIISLYPNPVGEKFTVFSLQFTVGRINIYNVLGQVCLQSEISNPIRQQTDEIDVSYLSTGMYFVEIVSEEQRWIGKFVKQ